MLEFRGPNGRLYGHITGAGHDVSWGHRWLCELPEGYIRTGVGRPAAASRGRRSAGDLRSWLSGKQPPSKPASAWKPPKNHVDGGGTQLLCSAPATIGASRHFSGRAGQDKTVAGRRRRSHRMEGRPSVSFQCIILPGRGKPERGGGAGV